MIESKVLSACCRVAPLSFLAACVSAPPPVDRMGSVEASIRAARDLGSQDVPTARTNLRLALDEVQRARELSKNGENDLADSMLQRAAADAELAIALAQEAKTREEAQRALEQSEEPKGVQPPPSGGESQPGGPRKE